MLLTTLLATVLTVTPPAAISTTELHDQLEGLVADHYITAGLIHVRDGPNHWSDAVGVRDLTSGAPATPTGHFRIGSVTKTFVATVLLQLVDEGRLDLDDPIERHLSGVVPNGAITVRQLLQHTSGLYDYMSEPGYSTNRWRGDARFDDYTPQDLLDVAFAKGPLFDPGTSWHYSNTNYVVAGLLIEKLTGRPYGEEVARRILRPLKLTHTSVPGHRSTLPNTHAHGYEPLPPTFVDATKMDPSLDWAAGEMISTTEDLATFVTALIDGHLTSQESLTEMQRTTNADPLFRYGLGLQEFTIPCANGPRTVWGHTGQLIGYLTVTLTDGENRSLVLSLNPYEQDPPTETVLPMAATVFCPES